jgi:hypothetical protein
MQQGNSPKHEGAAMSVSYRRDESIAVITIDDGKVNVLGTAMLGEISSAFDQAEADDAGAVVLTGLVFGLYPARRAAAQDPIVALRHD